MTLVVAAEPQTETELAMTLCLLEAAGVPAFVSAGVGSLYPGPHIASYNTRRVLVPAACRDQAEAALRVLTPPLPDRTRWSDRLRVLLEWFLFGWFVQGDRRRTDDDDDAAPLNRDAQDP